MIKILFIEDEDEEINEYEKIFNAKKEIEFKSIKPRKLKKYLEKKGNFPNIFLVDYDLTKDNYSNEFYDLYGGSVYNYLKQRYANYPLILFSRYRDIDPSMIYLFDYFIVKKNLLKDFELYSNKLIEISTTFKKLANIKKRDRKKLFELLGIKTSSEEKILLESAPVISNRDIIYQFKNNNMDKIDIKDIDQWKITEVLKWIDRTLFAYPGIFYDSLHTATYLRLSQKDFLTKEIQSLFIDAKYEGIFSGLEDRWWKGRIEDRAYSFLKKNNMKIDLDYFPEAIEKSLDLELEKAKCIGCGKDNANTICYVLEKPTLYKHSIPYYPDNRPGIMEIARVSYQAILEGTKYNPDYIRSERKTVDNISSIMKEIKGDQD